MDGCARVRIRLGWVFESWEGTLVVTYCRGMEGSGRVGRLWEEGSVASQRFVEMMDEPAADFSPDLLPIA